MSGNEYLACGRHVLVDVADADPATLNNVRKLERSLVAATLAEGVTILGALRKSFRPSGVTILLMLAESHVSLHTYPEQRRAFFDAFTCGVDFEPGNIFRAFAAKTLPGQYTITRVERGSVAQVMDCEALERVG